VEDFEQAEALAGLGCVFAQGFLFARPQEAEVISEMLAKGGRCVPGLRWGEAVPAAGIDGPRVAASPDVALGSRAGR
jgi:predicted signal transduction protein with EAL and GGDEF domain